MNHARRTSVESWATSESTVQPEQLAGTRSHREPSSPAMIADHRHHLREGGHAVPGGGVLGMRPFVAILAVEDHEPEVVALKFMENHPIVMEVVNVPPALGAAAPLALPLRLIPDAAADFPPFLRPSVFGVLPFSLVKFVVHVLSRAIKTIFLHLSNFIILFYYYM